MTLTPLIAACLMIVAAEPPERAENVTEFAEWSKPVNGVRGRFFPVKDEYRPGEEIGFVFIFQNVGEKPVHLPGFRVMDVVTPEGADRPGPIGSENLRITLDRGERELPRIERIAEQLEELREDLKPGDLRILTVTVEQGARLEQRLERLRKIGAPDRAWARLPAELEPGEHRLHAIFAPAGLPVPEGVERLEREKSEKLRIWEGKPIRLPPAEVHIAEADER